MASCCVDSPTKEHRSAPDCFPYQEFVPLSCKTCICLLAIFNSLASFNHPQQTNWLSLFSVSAIIRSELGAPYYIWVTIFGDVVGAISPGCFINILCLNSSITTIYSILSCFSLTFLSKNAAFLLAFLKCLFSAISRV